MSDILAAYEALGSMTISVSGRTPDIYFFTEQPNAAETANLPLRLLEVVGSNAEMSDLVYGTIGSAPQVDTTWRISDLLLWMPQAQGTGVRDVARLLVDYCGKYVETARMNRDLTEQISIASLQVTPGTFRYPADGERVYYGVRAVMGLKELIG